MIYKILFSDLGQRRFGDLPPDLRRDGLVRLRGLQRPRPGHQEDLRVPIRGGGVRRRQRRGEVNGERSFFSLFFVEKANIFVNLE